MLFIVFCVVDLVRNGEETGKTIAVFFHQELEGIIALFSERMKLNQRW